MERLARRDHETQGSGCETWFGRHTLRFLRADHCSKDLTINFNQFLLLQNIGHKGNALNDDLGESI